MITGCTRCSDGCLHCYSWRHHRRLARLPNTEKYRTGFDQVVVHPEYLGVPATWKKPRRIFVCSLSDLFHPEVPDEFIRQVFEVMNRETRHLFLVLTKRSKRMLDLSPSLTWTPNIWAGVTIESIDYLSRLEDLRQVPAGVRWISAEPLLSPLPDFDLSGIHWVVIGGESGPDARPMDPAWARDLRDQCLRANVPVFFKQMGGSIRGKGGDQLDGQELKQYPR